MINIKLPPLKERRLDIEPLAGFFVSKFSKREGKKIKAIDREVTSALHRYAFPGNVRELENIMERAVILAKGDTILPEDLPKTVLESSSYEMVSKTPQNYAELKAKKRKMIEELEKDFVKHILSIHNDNIPQAAREAKMHRVELHRLVKKYKE